MFEKFLPRKCTSCGSFISGEAKVCPYCRSKQKKGWHFIKRVILGALAIIAILFIITPRETDDVRTKQANEAIKKAFNYPDANSKGRKGKISDIKSTQPTRKADVDFKIGEVKRFSGEELGIQGDKNNYLRISVLIKNISTSEQVVGANNFTLQSGKGFLASPDIITSLAPDSISLGTLLPGGEVQGNVYFKDVQISEEYILKFNNDFFGLQGKEGVSIKFKGG